MKFIQYFLKIFIIIVIISHLFTLRLFSQNVKKLMNYAETYQFDKLENAIKNLKGEEKEEAAVLYLRALIETDADKALAVYNRILEQDTETINAERALLRVAQYYYIKGLYIQSADVLKRIIIHFPDSFYAKKAKDQMVIIRDAFGERVKSAPAMEGEGLPSETKESAGKSLSSHKGEQYVVQLGAFSSKRNASRLTAVLKERGFKDIDIIAKVITGRKLHLVWYGNFRTKSEAVRSAEIIKKALSINYRIVELN